MKKRLSLSVLFLGLTVLFLASCPLPTMSDGKLNSLSLRMPFGGKANRSVIADDPASASEQTAYFFEVKCKASDNGTAVTTTAYSGEVVTFTDLYAGTYAIEVSAYYSESLKFELYKGSASVPLEEGETKSVNIKLTYVGLTQNNQPLILYDYKLNQASLDNSYTYMTNYAEDIKILPFKVIDGTETNTAPVSLVTLCKAGYEVYIGDTLLDAALLNDEDAFLTSYNKYLGKVPVSIKLAGTEVTAFTVPVGLEGFAIDVKDADNNLVSDNAITTASIFSLKFHPVYACTIGEVPSHRAFVDEGLEITKIYKDDGTVVSDFDITDDNNWKWTVTLNQVDNDYNGYKISIKEEDYSLAGSSELTITCTFTSDTVSMNTSTHTYTANVADVITTKEALVAAINAATNNGTETVLVIDGAFSAPDTASEYKPSSTSYYGAIIVKGNVRLIAKNSATISRNNGGVPVFLVAKGATLTIGGTNSESITVDGKKETYTSASSLISVLGGTLVLDTNSIIQNNMNGGSYSDKGTIYLDSSATNSTTAFTMNGGLIQNCDVLNHGGGAVYSNGTSTIPVTVTLQGGEISGNTSSGSGGALYLYNTTANLAGTTIKGNTAKGVSDATSSSDMTSGGGAIYVNGSKSSLKLNSGTITGNVTNGYGGALLMASGSLTIQYGSTVSISDNHVKDLVSGNGAEASDRGAFFAAGTSISVETWAGLSKQTNTFTKRVFESYDDLKTATGS